MSEEFDQLLAAARDRSALVYLDVMPPRDAARKQFIASVLERVGDRPQGQATSVPVTAEEARALLDAGANWKGPAHMRDDVLAER